MWWVDDASIRERARRCCTTWHARWKWWQGVAPPLPTSEGDRGWSTTSAASGTRRLSALYNLT